MDPNSKRLNPKLTKRNLAANLPLGDVEGGEEESEAASSRSSRSISETGSSTTSRSDSYSTTTTGTEDGPLLQIPRTNPRLHLIHNGRWIPRVYDHGRLRVRTGIWDCCGHPEHLSLYCESLERRDLFKKEIEEEKKKKVEEQNARIARKFYLLEQIQLIESYPVDFVNTDHPNNIDLPPPKPKEITLSEDELEEQGLIGLDPVEVSMSRKKAAKSEGGEEASRLLSSAANNTNTTPSVTPATIAPDSTTAAKSQSLPVINSSLNAPMMMQFLVRRCKEEPTILKGLEFVLQHLDSGEGCQLYSRHGLVNLLYRTAEFHHKDSKILLLVLQCFRQLLDCNFTRDEIMEDCQDTIVPLLFNIVYLHMFSLDHIEPGVRGLMQCTRFAECRDQIVQLQVIPYLLIIAKKFIKHTPPYFLNSLLKIFHWMCTDPDRAKYLLNFKVLQYCQKAMKCHPRHRLVLIPSIALFRKIILLIPATIDWMLQQNLAAMIVNALEIVYDNEEIQLEALKLLQIISMTSKGWDQISAIGGAWQRICQGTEKGDALVHDLPGDFQNPGWVLSETPYLPLLERLKLSAYENQKTSLELKPKAAWTAVSLRQYMGLSMAGQTLAINTEYQEIFFHLLTTLDLLPQEEEPRESFFIRIRQFEAENEVRIEEMVFTIQEMKRRDAIQKKMAAQRMVATDNSDFTGMTVKDIYVAGQKIDGKFLAENDIDLEEAFYSML